MYSPLRNKPCIRYAGFISGSIFVYPRGHTKSFSLIKDNVCKWSMPHRNQYIFFKKLKIKSTTHKTHGYTYFFIRFLVSGTRVPKWINTFFVGQHLKCLFFCLVFQTVFKHRIYKERFSATHTPDGLRISHTHNG